jgi:hypothetical protein
LINIQKNIFKRLQASINDFRKRVNG